MPYFKAIGADPVYYQPRVKQPPKINEGIAATGGQIFNQPIVGADSTTADPALAGQDLTKSFRSMLPEPPTGPTGGSTDGIGGTTGTTGSTDIADKIGGLTAPGYTKPDTTAIDARIAKLMGQDPEAEIRDRLARENAAIDAEYTQRTLDEQAASRNRMGEQFGGLANLMVNPLSSGAASVANAEDLTYKKLLQNLDLNRALQKKSAEANIRGEVTSGYANQLKAARDERTALTAKAQQDYENQRTALADNIAVINNAVAVAKSKRDATNQERDDAYNAYQKQITALGSKAFEGVSDADLKAFEKTAGLPAGFIRKNAETLKQQELANRYGKPELKEVGGNLYSLVWDPATGTYKKQTVVQKAGGGGAGSNGAGYDAILAKLKATVGEDKFINTDEYKRQRELVKNKADFDRNFASLLNPYDRTAQPFISNELTKQSQITISPETRKDIAANAANTSLDMMYELYPDVDARTINQIYSSING